MWPAHQTAAAGARCPGGRNEAYWATLQQPADASFHSRCSTDHDQVALHGCASPLRIPVLVILFLSTYLVDHSSSASIRVLSRSGALLIDLPCNILSKHNLPHRDGPAVSEGVAGGLAVFSRQLESRHSPTEYLHGLSAFHSSAWRFTDGRGFLGVDIQEHMEHYSCVTELGCTKPT